MVVTVCCIIPKIGLCVFILVGKLSLSDYLMTLPMLTWFTVWINTLFYVALLLMYVKYYIAYIAIYTIYEICIYVCTCM